WRRLGEVHEEYELDPNPLEELIEGAVWDLKDRPIQTPDDLIAYSNLVGGSVGAMMLPFLRENGHEDLERPARDLGIAMQITNILRDVGEDIERLDRVYLPTEWMQAHGVSRKALANGQRPDGHSTLLERTMTLAEERYRQSYEGVAALPFRTRVGIRAAARMYREILNEVRANDYDNLDRRAYVSFTRKLLLVAYDNYDWRKARLRT
ncbi:MAG: squalene/phytoene synthase family protein, partial [Bacteroidetes bacterium QH_1_61_8]